MTFSQLAQGTSLEEERELIAYLAHLRARTTIKKLDPKCSTEGCNQPAAGKDVLTNTYICAKHMDDRFPEPMRGSAP